MLNLIVDSFYDAAITIFRAINKNNSKLEKENLDNFFISIDLENRKNKSRPHLITTLEDSEKVLKIVLDNSQCMFSLDNYKEKEEYFINYFNVKKVEFEYDYNRNIIVSLYKELMKEKYNYYYKKANNQTDIFLGYDIHENEIWGSLDRHLMIGGSTGFGKSSFLNTLILNKLYENKEAPTKSPKIQFKLIDLKGVEFNVFEGIKNIEIAQDIESSIKILDEIKEEIETRKKIFNRFKVNSLEEYNNISNKKLDYIFLIIDEYACFQEMIEDKKVKEQVLSSLRQISSVCRSFGIKLIVASQKTGVSAGAMDSFFRSQISSNLIIGFKVSDENTSKTIIFDEGLEKLTRPGEALIVKQSKVEHIQTMYLSTKELKARLEKDIK